MNSFSARARKRGIVALLIGALLPMWAPEAFAQNVDSAVQVTPAEHYDTLPSLRDTPPAPIPPGLRVHFEGELPIVRGPKNLPDGALQGPGAFTPTVQMPATVSNFNGVGNGFSGPQGSFTVNSAPPDTNGVVGPNHYVQIVNSSFAVFNKSTNAVLYGPAAINTLWSGFGGGCQTNNDGDPVVVYDRTADRWVISQFSVSSTPYLQCVAVSATSDPTGAWNRYSFSYGNTEFPDYPKMGVWPDGYYITFNIFNNGSTFAGAKICAYDRTKMIAGAAATQVCFTNTSTAYGGVLPADADSFGANAPPAGSPNYIVGLGSTTTKLAYWKAHIDFTTPANSTLTGPTEITIASYSEACSGGTCIPQSGTSQQLDSLADRLMHRLAYRHFADGHESLVTSHSVTAGSATGVRWYELRADASHNLSVFQQGTYAPDATFRWMPSIAMDQQGNMAVGYSASSSSIHPQIRYTGRLVADAAGTMTQGEVTMIAGSGSQTGSGLSRWGDYSAMTIDPSDDCTFWYTTEYIPSNGAFNWSTRIGSFKFPSCGSSYTIGGGVTGLTASGLVMAVTAGSQTVSVPSGATSYVFATAEPTGTAYTVSVQTQPTGLTCSVANATGTVGTSNVTNANVSCSTSTYTVTPSVSGGNGAISPSTPQTINYNATTGFTLTPNTGYHIVTPVGGTCGGALSSNTYTTNAVTADCTVVASFAIDTHTLTYTAGTGGSIIGSSPQVINYGADGTAVTAVPSTGYHFVQWSDSSTANPRQDTNVTADISVTAQFAIDTHTLTYSAGTGGSITGTTPQVINYGADGTAVTAVPSTGYHFVQWSDSLLTAARQDKNVTADISVAAQFAINTYTLTYTTDGNGTINGAATQNNVPYGSSGTTVTAMPNTGYHFVQWSDGNPANPRTDANVQSDMAVTAQFAINQYAITPSVSGGNGTIGPASAQVVDYNTTTSFTLAPDFGYHIVMPVGGTCGGSLSGNSYTIDPATSDCTVIASFALNSLAFTVEPSAVVVGAASSVEVSVTDGANNVITTDSVTQVSISEGTCGTTMATATVSNGVAQFTNLVFRTVNPAQQLHAIANPLLNAADSLTFAVQRNPDWIFWNGLEACVP